MHPSALHDAKGGRVRCGVDFFMYVVQISCKDSKIRFLNSRSNPSEEVAALGIDDQGDLKDSMSWWGVP